jgi:hypothetical protein
MSEVTGYDLGQEILNYIDVPPNANNNSRVGRAIDTLYKHSDSISLKTKYGVITRAAKIGGSDSYDSASGDYGYVLRLHNPDGTEAFYKIDGYYSSWDGVEWWDAQLFRVERLPVTVVYEYKKVE